jgi:HAMP domain-containing protein
MIITRHAVAIAFGAALVFAAMAWASRHQS